VGQQSERAAGGGGNRPDQRDHEPLTQPVPRHLLPRRGQDKREQEDRLENRHQPTRPDRELVGKRHVQAINATAASRV
jgi:hypothetical protein